MHHVASIATEQYHAHHEDHVSIMMLSHTHAQDRQRQLYAALTDSKVAPLLRSTAQAS